MCYFLSHVVSCTLPSTSSLEDTLSPSPRSPSDPLLQIPLLIVCSCDLLQRLAVGLLSWFFRCWAPGAAANISTYPELQVWECLGVYSPSPPHHLPAMTSWYRVKKPTSLAWVDANSQMQFILQSSPGTRQWFWLQLKSFLSLTFPFW